MRSMREDVLSFKRLAIGNKMCGIFFNCTVSVDFDKMCASSLCGVSKYTIASVQAVGACSHHLMTFWALWTIVQYFCPISTRSS